MFSYEPNTFWDSIKPLIYYQRIIGLGIFEQPNQNRWSYHLMCFWFVAINLMTLPNMFYSISSLLIKLQVTWEDVDIKALTSSTVILTNFLHSTIAPFLIWSQRKAIWNRLKDLQTLDDEFRAVFKVRIHSEYRRRFFTLCFQITSVTVLGLLVIVRPRNWSVEFNENMWISLVQPLYDIAALNLNHWILLRYIEIKFIHLNNELLRLAEKSSPFKLAKEMRLFDISSNVLIVRSKYNDDKLKTEKSINFLRELRKIHFKLCKLARKMNSGFGVQNLIAAGTSFLIVTGLSYECHEFWKDYKTMSEAFAIFSSMFSFICIHSFRIWIISNSCWSVTKEADKTRQIIYELLKINYTKLRKEIRDFSVQLLQNPVSFDACGFFKLDHNFIQRVIATITTYLIILIQMSDPPKIKCGLSNNITQV